MNYEEALEVLFTQLPMFQRQGPAAYKVDLDGTHQVLELLGHPNEHLAVVHVAGTNGKGTVCHMVAAVLQLAGYRVGLFTSPHLKDFRERIRVNGQCMPQDSVVSFVEKHQAGWRAIQPSFFELTFGMALTHFQQEKVDVVVLETGMGGRLDSTNVFPHPLVTAITNVGWDHQQFLGSTIREIAAEKAGIIKVGVPVVVGRMRPEALSVIHEHAMRNVAEVYDAQLEEDAHAINRVQVENRGTARSICHLINQLPDWEISTRAIDEGLRIYPQLTGQRGRFEWLPSTANGARVLADCAHNLDGLVALNAELNRLPYDQLHVVFGTVADKLLDPLWAILPKGNYYWCAADIPRAKAPSELALEAQLRGVMGVTFERVEEALKAAMAAANPKDLILVTGSIFTVAEALPSERFIP
jgi:dihydrofolate synthase/folylpolyglutamate synthase